MKKDAKKERERAGRAADDAVYRQPLYDGLPPVADDGRPPPGAKRRRIWKKLRWLLWVLVLAPFVYFVVQIFIVMAPNMRYETALPDTMTDYLEVRGQAVFSEVPVPGAEGVLYYTVPAGQRVAAGAQVAAVYASEAAAEAVADLATVEAEIALLTEAQATSAGAGDMDFLLSQMQAGLYGLLEVLDSGSYGGIAAPRRQFALASNKLQVATGQAGEGYGARIDTLTAQKAALEAAAASVGEVTAPTGGYFVPSVRQDVLMPAREELEGMTPAELERYIESGPGYGPDKVSGHIVTDYRWHFYTVVTAKQAEKFIEGDRSLTLSFPDAGDTAVPVIVDSVTLDEQAGIAAVVLYCEYVGPEILQLRAERAHIIFSEQKGIRIDKNALHLVDIAGDDGTAVTYKGVYVKFGNMVYFRKIDILLEDEFYMLVPETPKDGVNEVRLYDEIVVDSGGVDLYDRKIL